MRLGQVAAEKVFLEKEWRGLRFLKFSNQASATLSKMGPIVRSLLLIAVTAVLSPDDGLCRDEVRLGAYSVLDTHTLSRNQKGRATPALGALLLSSEVEYGNSQLTTSVLGNYSSGSPTDFVGDAQVLSNIDVQGQEVVKIYELVYQYRWGLSRLGIGWSDLSTSFNTTVPSELLVNSSFGTSAAFGNTGDYGPSIYPIPSFGIKAALDLGDGYYLQFAMADPIVASAFRSKNIQTRIHLNQNQNLGVVEFGRIQASTYKVAIGAWTLNLQNQDFGSFHQSGVYSQFDYRIRRNLHPFVRLELATKVAERIYSNTVFGARVLPDDLAYGLVEVGFSSVDIQNKSRSEQVYEILYQRDLFLNLSTALSYQYIARPGGDEGSANAVTFRLRMDFDWIVAL